MSDFFADAARLRKAGQIHEACLALQTGLRQPEADGATHERAGRTLQKLLPAEPKPLRIRILGQCTTAWLVPVLTAVGWARGVPLAVSDGEYDNVLQDLGHGEPSDVVVLLPWTQRLLAPDDRNEAARIETELDYWRAAWANRRGARLIMVGYDAPVAGPRGALLSGAPGGARRLVRRMNDALREALPAGAAFIDLDLLAGESGRQRFYDARRYCWTRQPFSEDGTLCVARHLFAATRALTTGPKKVLVLDLDNTLWGGVVGELGPLGVQLGESADGEAFRAFQAYCKGLAQRGVVLAVASKNNLADAQEPFVQHPDMVLRLSDFAAFEAHWEPKARSLARIAERLRLGLDSFVFFDDNPAEREQVRQALPQVEVVDVPEEPAEYVNALERSLFFETIGLTAEDADRGGQYQAEAQREAAKNAHASLDDYLTSLDMRADLRAVDEADMQRVVQLLGKTNQFNLTTRRHGEDQVRAWMNDERAVLLSLRVTDRFGDHGLIGLVFAVPDDAEVLRVDTLLMSCRVIGRTVEHFLWGQVLERARELGFRRVRAEYIATAKNAQVATLLDGFGLPRTLEQGDTVAYEADLTALPSPRNFLGARRAGG
ncbi:methoxymalonyl-ACP biosynthesis protein FkbH [Deltaproteobacteria bacterium]|nr:methoxymalonyl-ACP biosynthesis protein FkbH [Deltaproteobacteria bacterium]